MQEGQEVIPNCTEFRLSLGYISPSKKPPNPCWLKAYIICSVSTSATSAHKHNTDYAQQTVRAAHRTQAWKHDRVCVTQIIPDTKT